MPRAFVHRLPMSGPGDTSALSAAIASGTIQPGAIRAILGKTEGNGCVNDFTRGYAVQSLHLALAPHLDPVALKAVVTVMSGGTEGGIAPHWLVLEARAAPDDPGPPALALGTHTTAPLDPREIGRMAQVRRVADGVQAAMADAGITQTGDVHFVQIKCPLLTADRIAAVQGDVATPSTLKSMGLSRGASALGIGVALGEIDPAQLSDAAIGTDLSLYSGRASCSAGVELMACEILVLGQSPDWSGPLRIAHGVMADAIDAPAIAGLLEAVEPGFRAQLSPDARARTLAVLAKAEASGSGRIRGARHTMLDDSDISATRHARGFVAGLLAGMVGRTDLFVSGGAEHQGPDGGGPCAILYTERTTP